MSKKAELHPLIDIEIHKAGGFVITTKPLGFVLTKQVHDFLLRVHLNLKRGL